MFYRFTDYFKICEAIRAYNRTGNVRKLRGVLLSCYGVAAMASVFRIGRSIVNSRKQDPWRHVPREPRCN